VKYFPESTIVELMRKMFELSLGPHLLLGGDNARRSYWKAYGGGPGIAYILRSFVPRLISEGFSQQQVQQILVSNAASAFRFCERSGK
jgi:phosphotriesterase-related protein